MHTKFHLPSLVRIVAAVGITFSAFIFTGVLTSAQENVVSPSDRVTRFVYVRRAPSGSSAEITRIRPGTRLPLVRSIPLWHEVLLNDGRTGFVSKSWTVVTPALPSPSADELHIHFLSIGAGTCTVVECPGPDAPPMVVDCGSFPGSRGDLAHTEEQVREKVQAILARHNVAPNVVLSHGDIDHYNWVPSALGDKIAGNIWQGGLANTYGSTNGGFQKWLAKQRMRGAQIHSGFPNRWHNSGRPLGEKLSCGLASTFVLTVNTTTSEKNASSLMLMIEYGAFTAVFTGDADGLSEDSAATNFRRAVKATVLSASHHGAQTHRSNSVQWAEATSPKVVIYSSGLKHGHPRCPVTGRYTSTLASVPAHQTHCNNSTNYSARRISTTSRAEYVTDVIGSIVVSSTGASPAKLTCDAPNRCTATIPH